MLTMVNCGGGIFAFSPDIPLCCSLGDKNAFFSFFGCTLLIFWVQDLNPKGIQDSLPEKGIDKQDRVAETKAK